MRARDLREYEKFDVREDQRMKEQLFRLAAEVGVDRAAMIEAAYKCEMLGQNRGVELAIWRESQGVVRVPGDDVGGAV